MGRIPIHIEQQIAGKQQLEQEIPRLQSVASEAKTRLDKALNDEVATIKDLDEYSYFRTEMDKNRIPMVDDPEVIKTMNGLRQRDYDANSIVSKLSNFEELQIVEKELKDSVELLTKKMDRLEKECGFLESEMDVHRDGSDPEI